MGSVHAVTGGIGLGMQCVVLFQFLDIPEYQHMIHGVSGPAPADGQIGYCLGLPAGICAACGLPGPAPLFLMCTVCMVCWVD